MARISSTDFPAFCAIAGMVAQGLAESMASCALTQLVRTLQPLGDRVHAVRIGGNDILNLLGVRRSRLRTAYDEAAPGT